MKKYLIPIIIVSILLLVILMQVLGFLYILPYFFPRMVFAAILVIGAIALAIGLVVVLIQRVKEIKEDEKDDLGKY